MVECGSGIVVSDSAGCRFGTILPNMGPQWQWARILFNNIVSVSNTSSIPIKFLFVSFK